MSIAVIPARHGSKRIPLKNIKFFCGKEMIGYAIESALDTKLFKHVIVSTDSEEIATVARNFGAETPFLRPPNLSCDYTTTVEVVDHAIKTCLSLRWSFDTVCCIYPCAPFIRSQDIIKVHDLINPGSDKYYFPITQYPSPIQRALRLHESGLVDPYYPEYTNTRTQDLENAYYDAGQFYWAHSSTWLKHGSIHSKGIGYVIPNWRVVDIDNSEDWQRAELLHSAMRSKLMNT